MDRNALVDDKQDFLGLIFFTEIKNTVDLN